MTKRILLADDDSDDRLLFQEVFSDLPIGEYELICMSSGQELLDFLNGITDPEQLPNLIVLDQNMPVLSGKDTLQKLKNSELLDVIPVIIYSTYNDKMFVNDCSSSGVCAVVSKPDSFEGYVEMVNNILLHASVPINPAQADAA